MINTNLALKYSYIFHSHLSNRNVGLLDCDDDFTDDIIYNCGCRTKTAIIGPKQVIWR